MTKIKTRLNFDHKIKSLFRGLRNQGQVVSPRGDTTKELLNISMSFDADEWFINYKELPLNFEYIAREIIWYRNADKMDLSIAKHATIWEKCIDQYQEIQSNYGHWLWSFGKNNMYQALDIMMADPYTRRAVVNINRPEHNYIHAPDVPCTMYMNFIARPDSHGYWTLDLFVRMRSQDAVYGLRNDLVFFQFVKLYATEYLHLNAKDENLSKIKPGRLYLNVDSFHIYERHFKHLDFMWLYVMRYPHEIPIYSVVEFDKWCHAIIAEQDNKTAENE